MDADTILRIKPALTEYLHEFDRCMGRMSNHDHLYRYVSGQLSDLDRKSVEPIADAAGVPPRTLQEFLSLLKWDEYAVIDQLQRRVTRRHGDPNSVGIVDETSYHKQGKKTACVQRQWCGSLGKTDNCVVSVQLGYAAGDFHTLLDGDLYLPKEKPASPLPCIIVIHGGGWRSGDKQRFARHAAYLAGAQRDDGGHGHLQRDGDGERLHLLCGDNLRDGQ